MKLDLLLLKVTEFSLQLGWKFVRQLLNFPFIDRFYIHNAYLKLSHLGCQLCQRLVHAVRLESLKLGILATIVQISGVVRLTTHSLIKICKFLLRANVSLDWRKKVLSWDGLLALAIR